MTKQEKTPKNRLICSPYWGPIGANVKLISEKVSLEKGSAKASGSRRPLRRNRRNRRGWPDVEIRGGIDE